MEQLNIITSVAFDVKYIDEPLEKDKYYLIIDY